MADQVIIEFVGDTKGLKPAQDEIQNLGKTEKELAASFKKANDDANKALQQRANATKQVAAEEKKLGDVVYKTAQGTALMADEFRELAQHILDGALEEAAIAVKEWADETGILEEKQKTLKQELKANTIELQNMAEAGMQNTAEYKALLKATGELKDTIGDVNAEIAQSGSDTRGLDKLLRISNSIASGFSLMQSAQALFGDESEDLQKTLLQVNSAMAGMNALQAIQDELTRKDSLALQGYNAVLKLSKGLQQEFAISAQASWAVITGGLTVAIAAMYGLYEAFKDVDKSAEEFEAKRAQEQADLNAKALAAREEYLRSLGDADKEFFDEQERERKQRLADGQADDDVQFDMLTKAIEKYQNKIKAYQTGYYDYLNLTADEEKERIKAFTDYINIAMIERNRILDNAEKERLQKLKEAADKEKKLLEQRKKDIADSLDLIALVNDMKTTAEEVDFVQILIDGAKAGATLDDQIAFLQAMGLNPEAMAEALRKAREGIDAAPTKVPELKAGGNDDNKDAMKSKFDEYLEMAQAFSNAYSQIIQAAFAYETMTLQNEKNKQLRLAGDNAAKREKIERDFAIKSYELAKKQAITNKALGIMDAIVATATAVSKALRDYGVPAGIPFMAIAGALGAVQIATIAATPLPAAPGFYKGTRKAPPGLKWVGEHGPELVNDGGGYAIMTNVDSMKLMQKYEIPALQSDSTSLTMPAIDDYVVQQYTQTNTAMDVDKLGKVIANEMKGASKLHLNIDKNGLAIYQQSSSGRVEYVNGYFRN